MRLTQLLPLAAVAALVGPVLAIPGPASAAVYHTVRRGETLTSVAATDGLSTSALAAANGLSTQAELGVGRELVIPPRGVTPVASVASATATSSAVATTAAPTSSSSGFVVPAGATLSGLALRFGTSVSALAAANDMTPADVLLAGRALTVPGVADEPSAPVAAAPAATQPAAPVASEEMVTPDQVALIAEDYGVTPSLAEAIADQESGFNDAEVSDTGAVGVMQIEPATWRDLTAGGLQVTDDSALDNIRGGVSLLHDLLADTAGNESEAIAAYYQGLASVRSHGMFESTRQYVRDVLALQDRYGG